MNFSSRLKQLRKEKNWNQAYLSDKIGIGTTAIGNYERGEMKPSVERLVQFARIFNVSIDYMLGITNYRGVLNEDELKIDPELTRIIELVRPTVDGVAISDVEWKMLNAFLEGVVKIVRERNNRNDNLK